MPKSPSSSLNPRINPKTSVWSPSTSRLPPRSTKSRTTRRSDSGHDLGELMSTSDLRPGQVVRTDRVLVDDAELVPLGPAIDRQQAEHTAAEDAETAENRPIPIQPAAVVNDHLPTGERTDQSCANRTNSCDRRDHAGRRQEPTFRRTRTRATIAAILGEDTVEHDSDSQPCHPMQGRAIENDQRVHRCAAGCEQRRACKPCQWHADAQTRAGPCHRRAATARVSRSRRKTRAGRRER